MNENNETDGWETQEIIRWIATDSIFYQSITGMDAEKIATYVKTNRGPAGLYQSFARREKTNFDDVDWEKVAEYRGDE